MKKVLKLGDILFVSILLLAFITSVVLLFIVPTSEERLLSELKGEYEVSKLLYRVEAEISSIAFPDKTPNMVVSIADKSVLVEKENGEALKIEAEQYTILKIDQAFLDNGVRTQGKALRNGLIARGELENHKDAYAIFPETPVVPNQIPPQFDRLVFFYLDGEVYMMMFTDVYQLKKV